MVMDGDAADSRIYFESIAQVAPAPALGLLGVLSNK